MASDYRLIRADGTTIYLVNSTGALGASGSGSTTNNNQRSVTIAPGAIVIQGAGQDANAIGDAVVRRLELAIGGRLA